MSKQNLRQSLIEEIKSKMKKDSIQSKVFDLLSDQNWHCRRCEGRSVASEQYAGGGGIQGLERGTKSRSGLVIETKDDSCQKCQRTTKWDRWTGEIKEANAAANIPKTLVERILKFYSYTDVVEQRKRPAHELVIDHRFPMARWGKSEEILNIEMNEDEIKQKFQLLKKDQAGNHNLLKSRSCENCIKTGERGKPFGIKFWYEGGMLWNHAAKFGEEAEQGCIGCGWYDFETWRNELNQTIANFKSHN